MEAGGGKMEAGSRRLKAEGKMHVAIGTEGQTAGSQTKSNNQKGNCLLAHFTITMNRKALTGENGPLTIRHSQLSSQTYYERKGTIFYHIHLRITFRSRALLY